MLRSKIAALFAGVAATGVAFTAITKPTVAYAEQTKQSDSKKVDSEPVIISDDKKNITAPVSVLRDAKKLQELMDNKGLDPNATFNDKANLPLLLRAIITAHQDACQRITQMIINACGDPTQLSLDPDKRKALEHVVATSNQQQEAIDLLIKRGADVNLQGGEHKTTALHLAAFFGNGSAVRSLLANGADAEARDLHNATPFHLAFHNRNYDAMSTLLHNAPSTREKIEHLKRARSIIAAFAFLSEMCNPEFQAISKRVNLVAEKTGVEGIAKGRIAERTRLLNEVLLKDQEYITLMAKFEYCMMFSLVPDETRAAVLSISKDDNISDPRKAIEAIRRLRPTVERRYGFSLDELESATSPASAYSVAAEAAKAAAAAKAATELRANNNNNSSSSSSSNNNNNKN